MPELMRLLRGVNVQQDSQTHAQAARNIHFVATHEGYVSPAHSIGRDSGEFGIQIAGCGKGCARDVIQMNVVCAHKLREELRGRL